MFGTRQPGKGHDQETADYNLRCATYLIYRKNEDSNSTLKHLKNNVLLLH